MSDRIPGVMADTVVRLFARGEAFDSEGFIGFFADKPLYQFGNAEPCLTKEAIKESVDEFFAGIDALYHNIRNLWEVDDLVFVEMDVRYWRKDGTSITLPCCDIFRFAGDRVQELRIFMDANPVVDPSLPVGTNASVMTQSEGAEVTPPGLMRNYFAEQEKGDRRLAASDVPKWAIAGPRWAIRSRLDLVARMREAASSDEWEKFHSFQTETCKYRVGNVVSLTGAQAIGDYMKRLVTTQFRLTGMQVRGAWETGNVAIVEYDMEGLRLRDDTTVQYPCVDLYFFDGEQCQDWRVYPIESEFVRPHNRVPSEPTSVSPTTPDVAKASLSPILNAYQRAIAQADWQLVASTLTDDATLRVANRPEVRGRQVFVQTLRDTFSHILTPERATFVGAWKLDNVVVLELNVHAKRVRDEQPVSYLCVETYRFEGSKIHEVRVYPLEPTLLATQN